MGGNKYTQGTKGSAVRKQGKPDSAPGDLFEAGHDFEHFHNYPDGATGTGVKARVWAHKKALDAKSVPLLIYLHGDNGGLRQDFPQLFGPQPGSQGWLHAGKLLSPLIDQGKVVPLLLACPSVKVSGGGELWIPKQFDLSAFVKQVREELAGNPETASIKIDLDRVAITGHSGAGGKGAVPPEGKQRGRPGHGLNRVLEDRARFEVDGEHELFLFGVMDTRIDDVFGKAIRDGVADNKTTSVYALHRPHGGWGLKDNHKNLLESQESFCRGLLGDQREEFSLGDDIEKADGLDDLLLTGDVESAFPKKGGSGEYSFKPATAKPWCDSAQSPRRISMTVTMDSKKWSAGSGDWKKIPGAYGEYEGWQHHFDVIALWTLWAARRFFRA